jgi:hypothetical protein
MLLLAKPSHLSVAQPPLCDQVHHIRPHAFRYHAGVFLLFLRQPAVGKTLPIHPLSPQDIRLALPDSGSSLLCRRSAIRFHRLHTYTTRVRWRPSSAYGSDVPATTTLTTSGGQKSSCHHHAKRPTTQLHTHLPCSSASFILIDGPGRTLIAANNSSQTTHVGYGRRTCRNRICWPRSTVHHSAHTHQHYFLDRSASGGCNFSHLNARQPTAPPCMSPGCLALCA